MSQLIKSLEPRARIIAEVLSARLPDPGPWAGYQRSEPLFGTLVSAGTVRWIRKGWGKQGPSMHFGFLSVAGITGDKDGEPVVVASNVIERKEDHFQLEKPIKYTETIKHTFTRTQTLEEATKQEWEVSAKASFSAKYGGIGGSVEAAAKYGQELARKVSNSETISDEITKVVELQGPVDIRWITERSTDTLRQSWQAVPDVDFKLYFATEDSGWEWTSFKDVLIPALRGEQPVDTGYTIFGGSSDLHDIIEAHPVAEADLEELNKPLPDPVSFDAAFQTVNRQSIKAL